MTFISRILWTGLALLILAGGVSALWLDRAIHNGSGAEGEVRVEIPKGSSAPEVIQRLNAADLAPHPRIAYWVLRYHETFDALQAGIHVLPKGASITEVATQLKAPPTHPEVSLTLIPGETIWHLGERLKRAGLSSPEALVALASDRAWVRQRGLPVGPNRAPRPDGVAHTYLEGFLSPETHFFAPDASLEHVVTRLISKFEGMWRRLTQARRSDFRLLKEQYGLDDAEVITLASLVERETQVASEAPLIAGVFLNRLKVGMRLQTDPTLIYHPQRIRLVPTPTHRKDAQNPYNTYAHDGLPPGPICSPTKRALEAVLAASRHDFLYFCARRDGTGRHAFSRTLEEHESNVSRYLKRR